jgi:hypothetical protein
VLTSSEMIWFFPPKCMYIETLVVRFCRTTLNPLKWRQRDVSNRHQKHGEWDKSHERPPRGPPFWAWSIPLPWRLELQGWQRVYSPSGSAFSSPSPVSNRRDFFSNPIPIRFGEGIGFPIKNKKLCNVCGKTITN